MFRRRLLRAKTTVSRQNTSRGARGAGDKSGTSPWTQALTRGTLFHRECAQGHEFPRWPCPLKIRRWRLHSRQSKLKSAQHRKAKRGEQKWVNRGPQVSDKLNGCEPCAQKLEQQNCTTKRGGRRAQAAIRNFVFNTTPLAAAPTSTAKVHVERYKSPHNAQPVRSVCDTSAFTVANGDYSVLHHEKRGRKRSRG